MDDLRVEAGPGAPRGLTVPAAELMERFARSSGPGGQHVNTADSKVQLSIDLGTTTALDEQQRARVLERLAVRLTGDPDTVLTISAEDHRSQWRNRATARQRLADLLREAVAPPVVRRATKPTRGSKRRRLKAKRIRAEKKQNRKRPGAE